MYTNPSEDTQAKTVGLLSDHATLFKDFKDGSKVEIASTSTISSIAGKLQKKLQVNFLFTLPSHITTSILLHTNHLALSRISQLNKFHNKLIKKNNHIWRYFFQQNNWSVNFSYLDLILYQKYYSVPVQSTQQYYKQHSVIKSTNGYGWATLDRDGITTGSLPRDDDQSYPNHDTLRSEDGYHSLHSTNNSFKSTPVLETQPSSIPTPQPLMILEESSLIQSQVIPTDKYSTLNWNYIYAQKYTLERNWNEGKYLLQDFFGQKEACYCLEFDNEKIIGGSRDNTIIIWNIKTGRIQKILLGHESPVLCFASNDGYLISGSSDKSIIVWNLESGEILQSLVGHEESVLSVKYYEGFVISSSRDKTIKIWNFETGVLKKTLNGHREAINSLSVKNGIIVSASGDRTIKIWDFKSGELQRTLKGHSRGIACVQFDGDNCIASGSSDGTIKIWDLKSGDVLKTLNGHTELVRTLQFNKDMKLVSGSYDSTIKVWDMKKGKLLLDLKGVHKSWIFKIRFNKSKIISCSRDNRVLCWDFGLGVDENFFL
ncbi:hypothetical protein HDU92_007551 [Lobulomyces angularis]|nr:hypothetical protein HDU92_007551 [Lobulomyces angularis]